MNKRTAGWVKQLPEERRKLRENLKIIAAIRVELLKKRDGEWPR